jgi:hypothetical protein
MKQAFWPANPSSWLVEDLHRYPLPPTSPKPATGLHAQTYPGFSRSTMPLDPNTVRHGYCSVRDWGTIGASWYCGGGLMGRPVGGLSSLEVQKRSTGASAQLRRLLWSLHLKKRDQRRGTGTASLRVGRESAQRFYRGAEFSSARSVNRHATPGRSGCALYASRGFSLAM